MAGLALDPVAGPAVENTAQKVAPHVLIGAVCAQVVLREGMKADEEELIEFVKQNLASYKKPKRIEFVDQIPRTLTGKILKRELRAAYWEGRDRKV